MIDEVLIQKEDRLKRDLSVYQTLAIAYSGGVDSTYLAAIAHSVLGQEAQMILADSPSLPQTERSSALEIARSRGWNMTIINTEEFKNDSYLNNDNNRCYLCKSELFEKMRTYALNHHIRYMAYGAIEDDKMEYRPGQKAAAEYQVVAPLQSIGLFKKEIRHLSKALGLPTWNKPSMACLSSRIPTGSRITEAKLKQVEEVEEILRSFGFYQYRARHHDNLCRIEIDPLDFHKILDEEIRHKMINQIQSRGFRFVTLDLLGYRPGSTAPHSIPANVQKIA